MGGGTQQESIRIVQPTMNCIVCGYDMGNSSPPCARCGQTPIGGPARSTKLDEHVEDMKLTKIERDLEAQARRKRRLWAHALTGILTYFILQLLLRMPLSFGLDALFWNLVSSTLIGAPVGYVISYFGGGQLKGGLISAFAFFLVLVLGGISSLSHGETFGGLLVGALLRCPIGSIPGIVIGLHVDVDD